MDDPMLVDRMRKTDPNRHVRIVDGSGTTVRCFLAEYDTAIEGAKADTLDRVALALASFGGHDDKCVFPDNACSCGVIETRENLHLVVEHLRKVV